MFNFRHYLDLLIENKQMATSILNQATIKQQEGTLTDNQFQEIKHVLEIAPAVLIKNNRLVWFFRIIKAYVNGNLNTTQLGTYRFISLVALLDKLAEYYNPNNSIESIEKYSFSNQTVSDVLAFFEQEKEKTHREQEAKQEADRGVDPQENDYILFKFQGNQTIANDGSKEFEELPFDYAWWWIDRAVCPEEGRSGHHCGNVAGQQFPDQRILSFRDNQNRVQMTFIREPDGTLGEMRANYNQKPNSKFHPYIMPLLMWDRVEGIKGAPYGSSSAFSIFDLNSQQLDYLDQHKPKLIIDQIQITPFDILGSSNAIKQKYREVALKKEPLISNVLSDSSLENWTNLINQKKELLVYLPIEYYDSSPNFKDQLLEALLSQDIPLRLLLKCPVKIRKDPIFLEKLVRGNSLAIKFIIPPVKNYEHLCKIAVTDDSDYYFNNLNLCYIPENYRTQELCELSINVNLGSLICFPKDSPIAIRYLKSFLDEFEADDDRFYKNLLHAIPENQQTLKVYEMLVKHGGSEALMHIPEEKRTLELCKIAMYNDNSAMEYIPDHLKHHFNNKT